MKWITKYSKIKDVNSYRTDCYGIKRVIGRVGINIISYNNKTIISVNECENKPSLFLGKDTPYTYHLSQISLTKEELFEVIENLQVAYEDMK